MFKFLLFFSIIITMIEMMNLCSADFCIHNAPVTNVLYITHIKILKTTLYYKYFMRNKYRNTTKLKYSYVL